MTFKDEMTSATGEIIDAMGEPATFKGNTINVVFANKFNASAPFDVEVEGFSPVADAKTADVSTAVHGDTLTIGAKTYYIRGIQPDDAGMTRLILSED